MTLFKSFAQNLGTEFINVYVGPNRQKFLVHRQLLNTQTSYFEKLVKISSEYSHGESIELENEDPVTIELLISYLYQGSIPKFQHSKKIDDENKTMTNPAAINSTQVETVPLTPVDRNQRKSFAPTPSTKPMSQPASETLGSPITVAENKSVTTTSDLLGHSFKHPVLPNSLFSNATSASPNVGSQNFFVSGNRAQLPTTPIPGVARGLFGVAPVSEQFKTQVKIEAFSSAGPVSLGEGQLKPLNKLFGPWGADMSPVTTIGIFEGGLGSQSNSSAPTSFAQLTPGIQSVITGTTPPASIPKPSAEEMKEREDYQLAILKLQILARKAIWPDLVRAADKVYRDFEVALARVIPVEHVDLIYTKSDSIMRRMVANSMTKYGLTEGDVKKYLVFAEENKEFMADMLTKYMEKGFKR